MPSDPFQACRRQALVVCVLAFVLSSARAQKTSEARVGDLTAKLRELRAECEEAAASVKQLLPDTHSQHLATRRSYGKARAAVEEVIGLLRQALLNGNEAQIAQDENLKRAAREAVEAGSVFLTTADEALKKPQKRNVAAVVAALSGIVAVALELVKLASASKELGDKVEERRSKRADQLEAELVWRSWSDLPGRKP